MPLSTSCLTSCLESQVASHSLRGSKSQVFFGQRKPARAAKITMASVTIAPIRDGNSGPKKKASARNTTSNTTAVNSAKGRAAKASLPDLFLPNILHMTNTPKNTMNSAQVAWLMAENLVSAMR